MPRSTLCALAALVALIITLTVAPSPAVADDQELLMLLAQATAEEPAVEGHPTAVTPQPHPEGDEGQEGSVPPYQFLVRKVLREAQKLAELGGLTLAALLLGLLFLLGQTAFLGFTALAGATAPRHMDDVGDLITDRPWATFGLGLVNALVGVIVLKILLSAPPLRLFGIVALAWFLVRLLMGPASQARRVGGRLMGTQHPAAPALGALVTGAAVLVPVAGQLALVVTAVQGLGAWIWLRLRRRPSTEAPDQPMTMA